MTPCEPSPSCFSQHSGSIVPKRTAFRNAQKNRMETLDHVKLLNRLVNSNI